MLARMLDNVRVCGKLTLMLMDRSVRNILAVYNQATTSEHSGGMAWYETAHDEAAKLHSDITVGSGVVAALSPGLRWESNIEAARRVIADERLDGLGIRWYANVFKAARIARGEHPSKVLGGNKVRAFWRCIESPLNPLFVCIDGHAHAITTGEYVPTHSTPKLSDKVYRSLSARYSDAADHAGILPLQMQAVTWCVWRRLHVKGV